MATIKCDSCRSNFEGTPDQEWCEFCARTDLGKLMNASTTHPDFRLLAKGLIQSLNIIKAASEED